MPDGRPFMRQYLNEGAPVWRFCVSYRMEKRNPNFRLKFSGWS